MAKGRLQTSRSAVNMSSTAHKETQYRLHPFTPETKPNWAIFLITAIIFQHSLYLTEPRMEGICLRKKPSIYFSFYLYLTLSGLNFPQVCIPTNCICIIFQ